MITKIPFQTWAGQTAADMSSIYNHLFAETWTFQKSVRVFAVESILCTCVVFDHTDKRIPVNFTAYGFIDFTLVCKGSNSIFKTATQGFKPVTHVAFQPGSTYLNNFEFSIIVPGANIPFSFSINVLNEYGFLTGAPITFHDRVTTWDVTWDAYVSGWYSYTD
jgi:hypothetical protein